MKQMQLTAELIGAIHKKSFIFPQFAAFSGAVGCLEKLKVLRRKI
jgi:hypothetical protein